MKDAIAFTCKISAPLAAAFVDETLDGDAIKAVDGTLLKASKVPNREVQVFVLFNQTLFR